MGATQHDEIARLRATILSALSDALGDNLERAEAHFRGWSPERMALPWSGNGESAQQVIDGYREHRSRINDAIAWVKENCHV
jgi:hypothetical protein